MLCLGVYETLVTLQAAEHDDETISVLIEVANPTADEKDALLDAVEAGELDLSASVAAQLKTVLATDETPTIPTPTPTPTPSPSEPGTDDEAPQITLSASTVAQGGTVGVAGNGFEAGERLTVQLHSTPVTLGTIDADSAGNFSAPFTIPASTNPGVHRIVVSGDSGEAEAMITVTAVPAVPAALSVTGSEIPVVAIVAGAFAVLLGATLLVLRRITRRRTTS